MTNPLPDDVMASTALDRLEKLHTDQYVIVFGPDGRQFFATPNGYTAVQLPMAVLKYILTTPVKKVTWATYGSHPDSWFFAFELQDGSSTIQVGAGIPFALQRFIERIASVNDLRSALRVQLGDNDSFVSWAKTSWVCNGAPAAVEAELCKLSSAHMRSSSSTRGSLKSELSQVVWHADGTYFIKAQQECFWNFDSSTIHSAWVKLWSDDTTAPSLTELSELVLVALDPHAPMAETFVFIKKQHDAHEAPFVLHFHDDTTHTAKALEPAPSVQTVQATGLQHIKREPERRKSFRWAISKHTGRPHLKDSWELELKKGRKVKVWKHLGRDWYMAEDGEGIKGWVHGAWLAFCGSRVHKDPRSTYTQFQEDMRKLLVPGQLLDFPSLRTYMNECESAVCQPMKATTQTGICVHELHTLLDGSGQYAFDWLKEERNVWHPDKFARYCRPSHKEHLKASAQEVFVLYGVLMDTCKE